jgi:glycosyltransferase involved in cell wall biosynthesis
VAADTVNPRVSIVIPYHDEPEEFLRESLQSALAQTVSEWEVVVVDDASTTGHAAHVVAALGDPRLKVLRHEENRGLGASRNSGFRAAAAPLVALLDADDRLDPVFLEGTLQELQDHPEADWVVPDWAVFGTRDEVWPLPVDASVNCPAHFIFVGAGALIRTKVWERVGGYAEDPRLRGGEDWDFWITAAEQGLRPRHLPRPLYQYRLHPAAMSRTASPHNEYGFRRMILRRHRPAFRSMGLECPQCPSPAVRVSAFLAQGCLVASYAALRRGERLRAVWLALRGLSLRPRERALHQQLGRAVLPGSLRTLARRILRQR